MPSKTDFGDLTLYASSGADAEETFLKFRTDIAGTSSDSNFSKIANILSSHDFYIQNDRRIFDVSLQRVSDNYYESISSEITRYFPYMIIIFDVSDSNTNSVSVNINSLGNLPVKKFDVSGNIVNLESGDLTANSKYLAEYVGEYFILLSRFTAKEILEKLKTVDGTSSGLDADLLDGKPFKFKACEECNILPICMGGCPYEGLKKGSPDCEKWRYSLIDILKAKCRQEANL